MSPILLVLALIHTDCCTFSEGVFMGSQRSKGIMVSYVCFSKTDKIVILIEYKVRQGLNVL